MTGLKVVQIPSDERGNVDLDALRAEADDTLVGMMLTNPNTLGLFDENVEEVCKIRQNRPSKKKIGPWPPLSYTTARSDYETERKKLKLDIFMELCDAYAMADVLAEDGTDNWEDFKDVLIELTESLYKGWPEIERIVTRVCECGGVPKTIDDTWTCPECGEKNE